MSLPFLPLRTEERRERQKISIPSHGEEGRRVGGKEITFLLKNSWRGGGEPQGEREEKGLYFPFLYSKNRKAGKEKKKGKTLRNPLPSLQRKRAKKKKKRDSPPTLHPPLFHDDRGGEGLGKRKKKRETHKGEKKGGKDEQNTSYSYSRWAFQRKNERKKKGEKSA